MAENNEDVVSKTIRLEKRKGTLVVRNISTTECNCKRQAKFYIRECVHAFCGRCLVKHPCPTIQGFVCPMCILRDMEPSKWIAKEDFYHSLREKSICIQCYQEKGYGNIDFNPGLCLMCIRELLDNESDEQYIDKRTYNRDDLFSMWTATISEMNSEFFQIPQFGASCEVCQRRAVVKIKKCCHQLCWDCSKKKNICPDACKRMFPTICVEYYLQQLKSTMQLALIFVRPASPRDTPCFRCKKDQVYVKFRSSGHYLCQTCVKNIIQNSRKTELSPVTIFDSEVNVIRSLSDDYDIPVIFLEALHMALDGHKIAGAMFLRLSSTNKRSKCKMCFQEKICIEKVCCCHQLCPSCLRKKLKDNKMVSCVALSCTEIPVHCLEAVIDNPIDNIFQNSVDFFNELNNKDKAEHKPKEKERASDATSHNKFEDEAMNQQSSHQSNNQKFRPSYGMKTTCHSCKKMAVIKSEQCSHDWCVTCLSSRIREKTRSDDDLPCNDSECTSNTTIQYAKRFLKTCKLKGSLIPAFIKILPGKTKCDCKSENQALFEEIECGHQFCRDCLEKTTTAYSSSTEYIFHCPKVHCSSEMDKESSNVLYKHIRSHQEETLFTEHLSETSVRCDNCKTTNEATTGSECGVRIRRCGHVICHHCYNKLRAQNEKTISKCPIKQCDDSFIIHSVQRTTDEALVVNEKTEKTSEENIGSNDPFRDQSVKQRSENLAQTSFEKTKFTFLSIERHEGTRENGLPNLGLSCYRNAVYQILAESPSFFSDLRSICKSTNEDWTFTLCEILWRIKQSNSAGIDEFLYRMENEFSKIDNSFVEYRQNDCLSFFTSLLNGIKDEIPKIRKHIGRETIKDPTDCFRGQLQDKFTCCKCRETQLAEPFDFFSLPLPTIDRKDPKIGESLFKFLEAEALDGMIKCSKCDTGKFEKETKINAFPEILVLQLGMITEQRHSHSRVLRSPKFWETFQGLTNSTHLTKIDKKEFSKYKLYGVIVHIGGMYSGHYYAYVKNLRTDEWELRDDSYVKKVDLTRVLESGAYILFYHKSKKDTEIR